MCQFLLQMDELLQSEVPSLGCDIKNIEIKVIFVKGNLTYNQYLLLHFFLVQQMLLCS